MTNDQWSFVSGGRGLRFLIVYLAAARPAVGGTAVRAPRCVELEFFALEGEELVVLIGSAYLEFETTVVLAIADATVLGGTKLIFMAPLAQNPERVGHHAGAGPKVPKHTCGVLGSWMDGITWRWAGTPLT